MFRIFQIKENCFKFIYCSPSISDSDSEQSEPFYEKDFFLVKASCLVKDAANLSDIGYLPWDDIGKEKAGLSNLKILQLKHDFPCSEYNSTKTPEKAFFLIPLFRIYGVRIEDLEELRQNTSFRELYWSLDSNEKPIYSFSAFGEPGPIKSIKLNGTEVYTEGSGLHKGRSAFFLLNTERDYCKNILYIGAFIGGSGDNCESALDSFYKKYLLNEKKEVDDGDTKIEISVDIRQILHGLVVPINDGKKDFCTLRLCEFHYLSNNYILTVELTERREGDNVLFEVVKRIGCNFLEKNKPLSSVANWETR
ncbi:hypothetical protein CDIK_0291 [Cucumispora dikerogammari]|nr:hypothetical protein CDIK_0291 [Cucumispora dikerogammari]